MNSMTLLHHFESAGQAQLYISWFMVLKPWNILRRTFAAIAPSSGNDLTNFSQKLLFPYAWEGDDKRWLFQKAFICWNNLFRLYGWPILILFFVFTILKPSYVHMYTSLSMGKGIYILNMPICQAPKGLQNWRIKATRGLVLINWCAAFIPIQLGNTNDTDRFYIIHTCICEQLAALIHLGNPSEIITE